MPYPLKTKANTNSSNMSIEEHNTLQSINSDPDDRK